jgi:hypothetical protein
MSSLEELFQAQNQGSNELKHLEVLRDLADAKKQKVLSELSDDEIRALMRLLTISTTLKEIYGYEIFDMNAFIDRLLLLRANKDRKRALEIVDAFKSDRNTNLERSIFRRGMGGSGGVGLS